MPRTSRPVERAEVLRDVMEHVVEATRPLPPPKKSTAARNAGIALCVLLLAVSTWSWIARPAWIWGAEAASPSAVEQEAATRLGLLAVAQRVEAHRAEIGRLPASLEEIGEPATGVFYAPISATVFELRATHDQGVVVYRSDEPVEAFLGNSAAVISRGVAR